MINNFNKSTRKDDQKLLIFIVFTILFMIWICTPPGNKFIQMCFWGNNTKMLISKMTGEDVSEYIFHRNNAVYLAKMYPKSDKKALKEMNKAIALAPSWLSEEQMRLLYKDRAEINLYYRKYKAALDDFLKAGKPGFNDYLKIALLFKEAGQYKYALQYCNKILDYDTAAYAGYACLADIYKTVGRPEISIRIWDLAIDKKKNNARAYVDRALLKESIGDIDGYNKDMAKAKEYSPYLNVDESIIYNTMNPRVLTLTIN